MIAIDLSPLVLDPRRGVSRALLFLLKGLRDVGHPRVVLVGFSPPPPAGLLGLDAPSLGLDRLERTGNPAPRPRVWRRALALALHDRGAAVLLSPWAAFPSTRTPVVAWIHEVPFARQGALEGTLRTLRHRRALARAVDRAAALVVPSDAVRADLLHVHPEAERRTHVVPHGFQPGFWPTAWDEPPTRTMAVPVMVPVPSGPDWPPGAADPPATPYALLVGTGRGAAGPKKKGVDVFVRAFEADVAGLTPVVVGDAPGLPAKVHVVREPNDRSLAALVARARVVVVPSRSEGFGYPMLEAFAAGVPVVASAAGALPEVSGGAARLVPAGDPDALAEAIARVATDEDLRARLIAAGKQRAREFPVEAMARGWLRVLCEAGGLPCPV